MRCVVKTVAGYYGGERDRPRWVSTLAEARVFRTLKLARGVVRLLADRRIPAEVVKRSGGVTCRSS